MSDFGGIAISKIADLIQTEIFKKKFEKKFFREKIVFKKIWKFKKKLFLSSYLRTISKKVI